MVERCKQGAVGWSTGKKDELGIDKGGKGKGGRGLYESRGGERWGRKEAWEGAKRYNALAKELGLTPTQLALAFCKAKWQVASTIIGVTTVAQLQEDIAAFDIDLSADALAAIDALRFELGDPAI